MIIPTPVLHDIEFLLGEAQSEIALLKANPADDPQERIAKVYHLMNTMWLTLERIHQPSQVHLSLAYSSRTP